MAPRLTCSRCKADLNEVGHEPDICANCTIEEAFAVLGHTRMVRKSVAWTLKEYRRRLVAAGLLDAVSPDAPEQRLS